MSQTITINSQSISEQLNEWQLRNYDPRDSARVSVTSPSDLIPVRGVFRDDPTWDSFVGNIEEYRQQVDSAEKTSE